MAFCIKVKNPKGEVIWARQWATDPTEDQVKENTVADLPSKGGLFRHAQKVYQAILQIRDNPSHLSVTYPDGLEVVRA